MPEFTFIYTTYIYLFIEMIYEVSPDLTAPTSPKEPGHHDQRGGRGFTFGQPIKIYRSTSHQLMTIKINDK